MTYVNKEVQKNMFQETIAEQQEDVFVEPAIDEVVVDAITEQEVVEQETVTAQVEEEAPKKGTIFDSLHKLKRMFENQFKDNIE
jgi:hypothetical protein